MTEHIKEQISVFIDDELSHEECEFFVRRLQRDDESRRQYFRYQAIGAAVRGEHIFANHSDLRTRLQRALDEPEKDSGKSRGRLGLRLAAGAGIAASVAAVAIFALRFGGLDTLLPQTAQTDQRLELVEPPSYVVPVHVTDSPLVAPAIKLTGLQYLMHHGGVASHLSRTVVHSNVVAAREPALEQLEEDNRFDESR